MLDHTVANVKRRGISQLRRDWSAKPACTVSAFRYAPPREDPEPLCGNLNGVQSTSAWARRFGNYDFECEWNKRENWSFRSYGRATGALRH
jgi:hypothetical protein